MSANSQSVKTLWQNMPTEKIVYSRDQLENRVQKFHTRHKRRDVIEYSSYLVLFALVVYEIIKKPDLFAWISTALVGGGALIGLRNYNRLVKAKSVSSETSSQSLMTFLRNEIIRQRDAAATAWRWYILPFMPFFGFVLIYRWMEAGQSLFELTSERYMIGMTGAFMFTFLGATILWLFLRAARYQRELDILNRASTH